MSEYLKKHNQQNNYPGLVAVLFGGLSSERDVSIESGQAVVNAFLKSGVDVIPVDLGGNVISQLSELKCDRVFIALHGTGGEDGKVQAVLDFLKIPYTGSGVTASALAMDKYKSKCVWLGMSLPTPAFVTMSDAEKADEVVKLLGEDLFVKPVAEGSSIGMSCVHGAEALRKAWREARQYGESILVEQRIFGREFTVAILNKQALPPIELKVKNAFYDYDAKYLSDETEYVCPCNLDDEQSIALQILALQAFESLGCQGWGRVDFMQDNDGQFYLLEVNTVPGMTSHSLVPMAAKAAALSFEDLLNEILVSTYGS